MKYINAITKSNFHIDGNQIYDFSNEFQGFERKLNRITSDFEKYNYCRQSIYKVLRVYKKVTLYIEHIEKNGDMYGTIENYPYLATYQVQLKELFLTMVKIERKLSVKAIAYIYQIIDALINPYEDLCNLFFEPYNPMEIHYHFLCQREHFDSIKNAKKENKRPRKLKIFELPVDSKNE